MAKSRTLVSLVVLGALTLAGCNAQPLSAPAVPARAGAQSLEGVTMGYRQVAQQIFDDLDANKDNALDAAELDGLKKAGGETGQILMADRDGDAKVTRDEFMDPAYVQLIVDQIRFQMSNIFKQLDKNGDGRLYKTELAVGKGPIAAAAFQNFDRNNNGYLNLSEFEDLIWVEIMPKSVNPLNKVKDGQFPRPAQQVRFTVRLMQPSQVQTLMIKQTDATTPLLFATRPDVIPMTFEKELPNGSYSVTVKLTNGTAASKRFDVTAETTVYVAATRSGPAITTEAPSAGK